MICRRLPAGRLVSRRRLPKLVAAMAVAGCLAVTAAGPALADNGPTPSSGTSPSPALIGPAIRFFYFGDTLGLNFLCSAGLSLISTGASSFPGGAGSQAAQFQTALSNGCTLMSNEGKQYLNEFKAAVVPFAVINPYFNPYIQRFADMVGSFGTNYASSIAPFGPAVVGFQPDITYWEGT